MMQRLLDTVLSLGFLKLVWDGLRFLWNRLYQKRVTANLYSAYKATSPATELEKYIFLVVRNETDKPIAVDMFLWESRFWYRYIRSRKMEKIVLDKPIVRVAPHRAMQQRFIYKPGNIFHSDANYFGLRLTTGKVIWIKTRRWRQAFQEFKKDFPDWMARQPAPVPLKLKDYGAGNALP